MRARLLFAMLLCGFAGGCDATVSGAMDLAIGPTCRGSLSGAVAETILDCTITWDEKSGTAQVGNDGDLKVSDPALIVTGASFGFAITVDGDARAGTLSRANVSAFAAGVDVPGDGGIVDSYVANYTNQIGAPPNLGALSASITSFTLDFTNATETQWFVHGNLTATLVPVKTIHGFGTGTVQMTLDF
ncbi:MAG TPA: hypothetical protein VF945_01115 [Polyangia bacterium]